MKFYFKNLILKVGAIDINGGSHALVLDTVEKITQYNQSKGYDVGDHKLIFKNTYDDEENGKPKKFTINARSAKAPDVFFYVHIDVDLDAVPNYEEMQAEYANKMKQLMTRTRNQQKIIKRKVAELRNRRKNVESNAS